MYAPLSDIDIAELQKLLNKGIEIREAISILQKKDKNDNKATS